MMMYLDFTLGGHIDCFYLLIKEDREGIMEMNKNIFII